MFGEENMSCTEKVQTHGNQKRETGKEQSQEHAHHFFYIKGIVQKELVLAGQIVSSTYYCDILW
jgi:hypothetical protein